MEALLVAQGVNSSLRLALSSGAMPPPVSEENISQPSPWLLGKMLLLSLSASED